MIYLYHLIFVYHTQLLCDMRRIIHNMNTVKNIIIKFCHYNVAKQNLNFERVCIIIHFFKFGHTHIREMANDLCHLTCDAHMSNVLSTAIVTVCKRLIVLEDKKRILIKQTSTSVS